MKSSKVPTILIVEDEAIAALSLEEILQRKGYVVMAKCLSAEEALEIVKIQRPDIVLMDITLGGQMKGYDAAEVLNSRYDLPVIFLTSYSQENIIRKAAKSGSFAFLLKPYNENQLLVNIELALSKHHSAKTLKELNQTKDRFFSIVSHDLRNPLAALSHTSLLLRDKHKSLTPDELAYFLEEMYTASSRVYELTDNLLDWAKLQSNRKQISPENFSIKQLVDYILDVLAPLVKTGNIVLTNTVSDDIKVYADKNMIGSALNNLITNALKFSPDGGEVLLNAYIEDDNVWVKIKDQGMGMPPTYLDSLINGETIHDSETRSGIGLVISRDFILQNGGKIRAYSKEGQGTSIEFSLRKSQD